ncbi:hypothetical protein OWM54_09335 [Myxococcus sp. MISCRS1]|uniref:hypothetical protein n=1 Tax=Myxococcus sp. MISCRS1 TaxID=2996786 RepID=UPI00226ED027|nr:hypothetical protein [Myxococcus sp. MISCRS1]MCY0997337.1 hypothetical protein [Myxococcus sp. MISCRS1]
MEEGEEEERRWGGGLVEEEVEAAAPEANVEDDLLERLALGAGEGAVGAECAVYDALGGAAGEHEGEGLGGNGGEPGQGRPGLDLEPGEWIKRDC